MHEFFHHHQPFFLGLANLNALLNLRFEKMLKDKGGTEFILQDPGMKKMLLGRPKMLRCCPTQVAHLVVLVRSHFDGRVCTHEMGCLL
jgi:hypothetical protein